MGERGMSCRLFTEGVVMWLHRDLWASTVPLHSLPDGKPLPPPDSSGRAGMLKKKLSAPPVVQIKVLPPELVSDMSKWSGRMTRAFCKYGVPTGYGEFSRYCTGTEWAGSAEPALSALSQEFSAWRDGVADSWDATYQESLKVLGRLGDALWRRHDPTGMVSMYKYSRDFVESQRRHIPTVEEVRRSGLGYTCARLTPLDHAGDGASMSLAAVVADHHWVELRDASVFVHKLCESAGSLDYGGPIQFAHGAVFRFTSALDKCAQWDPCPQLSQGMYTQASLVPKYLRSMRHKLLALDHHALSTMTAVVAPLLPTLFSPAHRQSRMDYLMSP